MNRILAVAEKEFLELRRDPILQRLIFLLPSFLLILFGYAINLTWKGIPLVVYDGAQDRIAQAVLEELERDGTFRLVQRVKTPEAVVQALDQGRARAGLVLPPGLLDRVRGGESVALEIYLDGTDPNFAFQVQAALRRALQEVNSRILLARALAGEAVLPPLLPQVHTLYNPEGRTSWFMIPGIIGFILSLFSVLLTALSIVRESETRMMEILLASPLRPFEVVLGKVLPYMGLGWLLALLILYLGHWVFGVPIRGSLVLLFLALFLLVATSLALGVLISTLARTQVQAVFGTYAYAFPTIIFSGFIFPIEAMPPGFRYLTYLFPARYIIEILRGVLLKGQGFEELWQPLLEQLNMGKTSLPSHNCLLSRWA